MRSSHLCGSLDIAYMHGKLRLLLCGRPFSAASASTPLGKNMKFHILDYTLPLVVAYLGEKYGVSG